MPADFARVPEQAIDVLISVNPNAGSRSGRVAAEEFADLLGHSHLRVELIPDLDELVDAARMRAARGELRAVVAAGGDGTVRLIAERMPPGTPIAILPLGTENLLAKYLGMSGDIQELAECIARGRIVCLDAGLANGQLFTLMAGCGFDADVVRRLHDHRRGHIHHLSYVKPIVDAIRNYDYPLLRVKYRRDGKPDASAPREERQAPSVGELSARWVFVVNLPRYAGGLNFAPSASGTDGVLDVCTFREGSFWSGLLYLGGVVIGHHQEMDDFRLVRCTHLRIESDVPVPYQIDGDPGGQLPLEVSVVPGRLTFLALANWIPDPLAAEQEEVNA